MPGSSQIDPDQLPALVDELPGADVLREIAERAPAYLVGGAVRDLLLGRSGVDLDVAIEAGPDALQDLDGFKPEREAHFLTGKVRRDGLEIDIAQARGEDYPHPGALPEVRPASIEEDLDRRDFTINAMALPLGGEDRALLDPHGGLEDLRAGVLRVLHPKSFADDPTRALRAARYASRFGFDLEPETAKLIRDTDLTTLSEDRVEGELRRLADEPSAANGLSLIAEWRVMPALDRAAPARVADVTRLAEQPPWSEWADRALAVGLAITRPLPQIRELAAATPERPSEMVELARPWDPAQLLVARALGAEWLDRYAAELRHVRLEIGGKDLMDAGIPEGPDVGRGLQAALSGRLDGEIAGGRDEELRVAVAVARGEIPED